MIIGGYLIVVSFPHIGYSPSSFLGGSPPRPVGRNSKLPEAQDLTMANDKKDAFDHPGAPAHEEHFLERLSKPRDMDKRTQLKDFPTSTPVEPRVGGSIFK